MNLLDLFIVLPILWGAHKGYQKGFLLSLINFLAFFVALLLSFKFFHITLQVLANFVNVSDSTMPYLAFFITFGLMLYGILQMGKRLKSTINDTLLGSFDNLLGAVLGGLKYALFVSAFLWLFGTLKTFQDNTLEESLFYSVVSPLAPYVVEHSSEWISKGKGIIEESKEIIQESKENKENVQRDTYY
ncbi:membrane protein required for colicin V production [Thermonema lapsum]|uniref:Membrane protein required for colicin V production n=1 Tax=Thermonema lapsum TaxID=28195 RepID=A0A846MSS3_9BACT|nr:CvpA family protein [Thermonema lapsum]NIK74297.1 membrane protein required for colicin V production [Thermonema lapsum]